MACCCSTAARIAPRATLLIQAANGNPDEILNEVYAARGSPSAERWETRSGGHTGALAATPAEYERRFVGFFDHSLLGARARGGRRPGLSWHAW